MKRNRYLIFLSLLGISLAPFLLAACAHTKACEHMQSDIEILQNRLLLCQKKQNQASALSEQFQRSLSLMQDKLDHLDDRVRSLEERESEGYLDPADTIEPIDPIDQQAILFQQPQPEVYPIDQPPPLPQQPEMYVNEVPAKAAPPDMADHLSHQGSHPDADLYRQSLTKLREGDIESARKGFQEYLESSPETSLSDNALYWLAECFYQQKQFKLAAEQFQKVIDHYPTGNKVPAATLKLGYSYFNIADYDTSQSIFQTLIAQYPKGEEALLAKKMVDKITSLLNGPTQ